MLHFISLIYTKKRRGPSIDPWGYTNPATSFYKLNQDLDTLNEWSKQWIVTFNASKTELLIISKKCGRQMYLPLYLNNTAINEVTVHKHLRVIFNNKMSWRDHINDICKKCNKRLDIIQKR
jgi:hypothetical protein